MIWNEIHRYFIVIFKYLLKFLSLVLTLSVENIRNWRFSRLFFEFKVGLSTQPNQGWIVTFLVKILKLCQPGGIEEKPASPVRTSCLPINPSLWYLLLQIKRARILDQDQNREVARPQNLDKSKKHDQWNRQNLWLWFQSALWRIWDEVI